MGPMDSMTDGNRSAFGIVHDLGLEALLVHLLPEVDEVGRDHDAGDDLAVGGLELGDLGGEVLGAVGEAAAVDDLVAALDEEEGQAGLGAGQGETIGVVGAHQADGLVGLQLAPDVELHGGVGLDAPEGVVRPLERLVRRGAAAEVEVLPRAVGGEARHAEAPRPGRRPGSPCPTSKPSIIMSTPSLVMRSPATCAARLGSDCESLTRMVTGCVWPSAVLMPFLTAARHCSTQKVSASPNAAQRTGERRDEADLDLAAAGGGTAARRSSSRSCRRPQAPPLQAAADPEGRGADAGRP